MEKVEERFKSLMLKSATFSSGDMKKLDVFQKTKNNLCTKINVSLIVLVLFAIFLKQIDVFNGSKECLIEMPQDGSKIFREPENCEICESVTNVDKVQNISSIDFYSNYMKTSKPVVVTDGALMWPAVKLFNFDLFKNLYQDVEIDGSQRRTCQFFPYKTEFKSLQEVFNMSKERSELLPDQKSWYIGWSNCNDHAGKELQKYYSKPYFLDNNSENIALSWIFMGGPGRGAHMHVDNVHYPSWQAQLSGKKLWRLAPPPECLYKCKEIEVSVDTGEIIVLDTNRWYHQTFVLPGKISITIGSEFD